MEHPQQNNERSLEPEQAAAKAAILAQCDQLAVEGVTFVAVHFDGYSDDGTTEEVRCYDSEWYASGEHEQVKYDASHLQEQFEALVCLSGMRNDCGGFGDVVLNVSARKLTVERNDRFERLHDHHVRSVALWPTHSNTRSAAQGSSVDEQKTISQFTTGSHLFGQLS